MTGTYRLRLPCRLPHLSPCLGGSRDDGDLDGDDGRQLAQPSDEQVHRGAATSTTVWLLPALARISNGVQQKEKTKNEMHAGILAFHM